MSSASSESKRRSTAKNKSRKIELSDDEDDDLDFAPAISPLSDSKEPSPDMLAINESTIDVETEMFDLQDDYEEEEIFVDEPMSPAPHTQPGETGDSSDEREEAWLDALEAGRLDELDDELKKIRDPSLMTARQRAMRQSKIERLQAEEEMASRPLPEAPKLSKEMLEKRIQRAQKRKKIAEEKKEKEKKDTVNRLIKKTDARSRKKNITKKVEVPKVTYINGPQGPMLHLPVGFTNLVDLPKNVPVVKPPVKCAISKCPNRKKYNCSKTGQPLCSLECYKLLHVQQM